MSACIRCRKPIDATPFCPFCGAKQQRTNKGRKRGNGMGTAYKRRGHNTWTARVTIGFVQADDGRLIQKYRTKGGFRTQSDALKYCAAYREEIDAPAKAPTLQHYWDIYASGKMLKLSDSKQTAYEIAWKRCKALHLIAIDKIKLADIQAVINRETSTYYPAKDVRTLLSNLYKMAAGEGHVTKELPSLADIPSLEEKEGEPFTADEQKLLWKAYEKGVAYAAMPLIMIYTGMMPGELLRLRVEMIDFETRAIRGIGMKTKVRKKAEIVIPEYIIPLIEDMIDGRTSGKVFVGNKDNLYTRYYSALEAAGCRKLSPYSCRHTTATALAIDANVAPQTLQKAMRWSSTRMASRYVHPSSDDVRSALTAIKKPI